MAERTGHKAILRREHEVYSKSEFARLAGISNGHLYNLRSSPEYRKKVVPYEKTRPTKVSIGERRKPAPNGIPGYLRIDTVHQGDGPEGKGLYHINAVDEVTQWQVVAATPFISERYLLPVLEALLRQFPFTIKGFHSDNGSEFINRTVQTLLNKLLIWLPERPRPRADRDSLATTAWSMLKTERLSASTSASAISRPPMPSASTTSTPAF